MFDGEIVCQSKLGHGANFIFLMALDNENLLGLSQSI